MSTPDTTTAQIIAYATAALTALVVLFKLDISDTQQAAAITILSAVLGAFHLYSDARIRNGRASIAAAQVQQPQTLVQNAPEATGDATITTGIAAFAGVGGGVGDDGTPGHEPDDAEVAFQEAGDTDATGAATLRGDQLEDGLDGPLDPKGA